jgi:hypothetical protein
MSAPEEHQSESEPIPEPEGVGEGAEYEIAEGDEQQDGTAGATGATDRPDHKSPRGNPETDQSDVDEGIEKLGEISGN